MPERVVGCLTRESKESAEKLERTCQDKRLWLTGTSCRSPLTCVLSMLASREPAASTELIATCSHVATQPS